MTGPREPAPDQATAVTALLQLASRQERWDTHTGHLRVRDEVPPARPVPPHTSDYVVMVQPHPDGRWTYGAGVGSYHHGHGSAATEEAAATLGRAALTSRWPDGSPPWPLLLVVARPGEGQWPAFIRTQGDLPPARATRALAELVTAAGEEAARPDAGARWHRHTPTEQDAIVARERAVLDAYIVRERPGGTGG